MATERRLPQQRSDDPQGPLKGILVIDLARVLSGPYAAMMLGDLGARVIKIERPGVGDDTRLWGPPFVGPETARESTYFLSVNRNKESIALDLKREDDVDVLLELLQRADVLVENFRPGVLERLGLSHGRLRELNPRLIIVSITGFGSGGTQAHRSGYDQIVQGEAGIMSLTGAESGEPFKVGVPIADINAGMIGALGAIAALYERMATGEGQLVETSLLASSIATHSFQATKWLVGGVKPSRTGNRHPTVAPYGAYECADGLIQIAVGSESLWLKFAPLMNIEPDDPRFCTNSLRAENSALLDELVQDALKRDVVEVWLEKFSSIGIPAGLIKTLDEVYESPQVASEGLLLTVEHPSLGEIRLPGPPLHFDGTKRPHHGPPPTLGQHSEQIRDWLKQSRLPVTSDDARENGAESEDHDFK